MVAFAETPQKDRPAHDAWDRLLDIAVPPPDVAAHHGPRVHLGYDLAGLAEDLMHWSRETFGQDHERGPQGALRHLAKEAREALAAPHDASEYADCLLLVLDAARRAGYGCVQLVQAARLKMVQNRKRKWPAPTSNKPVEHVRPGWQALGRGLLSIKAPSRKGDAKPAKKLPKRAAKR